MNRIQKLKLLDDLFLALETHELLTYDLAEQDQLRQKISILGDFNRLKTARDQRQSRRRWLERAAETDIQVEQLDGSIRIQNRLEYEIERGHISKDDHELMSFHF
jgi:hypothetical protein